MGQQRRSGQAERRRREFVAEFEESQVPQWAEFYVGARDLLLGSGEVAGDGVPVSRYSPDAREQFDIANDHFIVRRLDILQQWRAILLFGEDALGGDADDNELLWESAVEVHHALQLLEVFAFWHRELYDRLGDENPNAEEVHASPSAAAVGLLGDWSVISEKPVADDIRQVRQQYAEWFCEGDIDDADAQLTGAMERPHPSDAELVSIGWAFGTIGILVLLLVFAASIPPTGTYDADRDLWEVFPLFRGPLAVAFMFLMWAASLYVMERQQMNVCFILALDAKTTMTAAHVLNAALFFLALWLLVFAFYLTKVRADFSFGGPLQPRAYVALNFGVPLAALFCPLPVLYRPSRVWILRVIGNVMASPLVPVTFAANFIADYLTSMVKVIIDFFLLACAVGKGLSVSSYSECADIRVAPIIFIVTPLMWRLLQCLRKARDAKPGHRTSHFINAGKYSASLVAAAAGFIVHTAASVTPAPAPNATAMPAQVDDDDDAWPAKRVLHILLLCGATIYSYTWDLVKDWSLWERAPGGGWQWRRLGLHGWSRVAYAWAAVYNLIGRLAWAFTIVADFGSLGIHSARAKALVTLVMELVEIARRSQWAVLRIANEHKVDCENNRAYRSVPPKIASFGTAEERSTAMTLSRRATNALGMSRKATSVMLTISHTPSANWNEGNEGGKYEPGKKTVRIQPVKSPTQESSRPHGGPDRLGASCKLGAPPNVNKSGHSLSRQQTTRTRGISILGGHAGFTISERISRHQLLKSDPDHSNLSSPVTEGSGREPMKVESVWATRLGTVDTPASEGVPSLQVVAFAGTRPRSRQRSRAETQITPRVPRDAAARDALGPTSAPSPVLKSCLRPPPVGSSGGGSAPSPASPSPAWGAPHRRSGEAPNGSPPTEDGGSPPQRLGQQAQRVHPQSGVARPRRAMSAGDVALNRSADWNCQATQRS